MACILRFVGRRRLPVVLGVRAFSAAAPTGPGAASTEAAAGIHVAVKDGILVVRLDAPQEKVGA
jgi:hypothetical protein